MTQSPYGPHQGEEVLHTGAALNEAQVAMILVHGRGASAENILSLAYMFNRPDIAYLAPQAANNTWYPQRFFEPPARNEPWLSSALTQIGAVIDAIAQAGIPAERTILAGFSQGACLVLEYAARNAQRYGGVLAFSGALIGPLGSPRHDKGILESTPVFLGCSDIDAHIPLVHVQESSEIMRALGGDVTERIYPYMDHTVNEDEIEFVRELLATIRPAQ